ncbi:MAG: DegT/DnrJ/EryC1/StrS family aminotransferase [Thermoleophilia bacterium]|nr:DegT/DnrJ/EryC1/StrS family aminotransferase [Thermoleophilia bacterium]
MRDTFLDFARPDLGPEEIAEVSAALASGWITTGPRCRRFEEEFARFLGAGHAVAVNSCTAAMHLALEAVGLRPGDEVVLPTYTFTATAEVVAYLGARPVLVDVQPGTLTLDPAALEAALSPRTRVVMPVHVAGHPADLEAVYGVAARRGLAVVEDAAHALPAWWADRLVGADIAPGGVGAGVPRVVCFSFYATKTLTTGEGGMLVTGDPALAERCRLMSLHGMSKDAWNRYSAEGSWAYEVVAPGFKYNMTDVAAAMGLVQLRRVEGMWRRRCEIAARYDAAFSAIPALEIPTVHRHVRSAWHLYMLRLDLELLTIDRAEFIREMHARNVGTSVHFIPLHLHPYYRHAYGYRPEDFPVALREFSREVSLPIYSAMSDADVEDVVQAVRAVVAEHRR